MPRKKIGELLVQARVATEEQVRQALAKQQGHRRGQRLGEVLLETGTVKPEHIARALAEQFHLPFVQLPRHASPRAAALVPLDFQRNQGLVLYRLEPEGALERLHVAVADPTDHAVTDELRFQLGKPLTVHVAAADDIQRVLGRVGQPGATEPQGDDDVSVTLDLQEAIVTDEHPVEELSDADLDESGEDDDAPLVMGVEEEEESSGPLPGAAPVVAAEVPRAPSSAAVRAQDTSAPGSLPQAADADADAADEDHEVTGVMRLGDLPMGTGLAPPPTRPPIRGGAATASEDLDDLLGESKPAPVEVLRFGQSSHQGMRLHAVVVPGSPPTKLEFNEADLQVLDRLEKLATGDASAIEAAVAEVKPAQVLVGLIRLLIKRGVIHELELLEELGRK